MAWKDVVTATNDTLQTSVVLVVAIAGYFKFVRGRVLHEELDPRIEPELVVVSGVKALRVTATIKNTGGYKMEFPLTCTQLVTVHCVDATMWNSARSTGDIIWTGATYNGVDLLRRDGVKFADEVLEPGQTIVRCRLLPIPAGTWVAYRVTLEVDAVARPLRRQGKQLRFETHVILLES